MLGTRRKKRGLFGGGMVGNPYGGENGTPPIAAPQPEYGQGLPMGGFDQPMEPQGKPGFFDKGGMGQYALAAVSDFVDRRQGNNPQALAGMMQQQQYERMQAAELAAEQRAAADKRMSKREDFIFEQDYKNANRPEPTATAMQRDYEWLAANHPEMAEQYLGNKVTAPPVVMSNADGTKTIYPAGSIPRGGGAATGPLPTFTDDDWGKGKPIGGASSNAGGGF